MGSSGSFSLNLDGALCGRHGCHHRRDAHVTRGFGQHRFECSEDDCHCNEFVIGGPEPHDTDEMPAVHLPEAEKP